MPQENLPNENFTIDAAFDAFVKILAHTLVVYNEQDKKFNNPDEMAEYVISKINKEK